MIKCPTVSQVKNGLILLAVVCSTVYVLKDDVTNRAVRLELKENENRWRHLRRVPLLGRLVQRPASYLTTEGGALAASLKVILKSALGSFLILSFKELLRRAVARFNRHPATSPDHPTSEADEQQGSLEIPYHLLEETTEAIVRLLDAQHVVVHNSLCLLATRGMKDAREKVTENIHSLLDAQGVVVEAIFRLMTGQGVMAKNSSRLRDKLVTSLENSRLCLRRLTGTSTSCPSSDRLMDSESECDRMMHKLLGIRERNEADTKAEAGTVIEGCNLRMDSKSISPLSISSLSQLDRMISAIFGKMMKSLIMVILNKSKTGSSSWMYSHSDSSSSNSYPSQFGKIISKLMGAMNLTETDISSTEFPGEFPGEILQTERFDQFERQLLPYLSAPGTLHTTWEDVGGCSEVLQDLKEQVLMALVHTQYHTTDPPLSHPKGVLLYGEPGCGKTLIAKAIAGEVNAHFLSLNAATLKSKWLGESEKLSAAVFSLAYKKQPCVVFLDEIDAVLGKRTDGENSNNNSGMVATFLTHWDGMETDADAKVILLAATNRLESIDVAILRRLSIQFKISKPSTEGRQQILYILLRKFQADSDIDLAELARLTDGYTGSDLNEVVRRASFYPMIEFYLSNCDTQFKEPEETYSAFHRRHDHIKVRPITMADLQRALQFNAQNMRKDTPVNIYI
ncbi:spastin-like [Procambarus clarkii]|uniref:spastin-like n=1 Tax=Procambarus clarkii TaxID=6728 RepID=UPI0037435236